MKSGVLRGERRSPPRQRERSGRGGGAAPSVAAFDPSPAHEEELCWFFCAQDGDFASQSTFGRMLTPVTEDGEWRTPEDHAVATRRHARVRAWLRAMPDRDAGILQCAYLPHPWPILLARELGRLTGIVVRLSCDRATWPEPRGEQLAVDAQNADRLVAMLQTGGAAEKATLRGLAREARAIFARALGRYAAARGRS